MLVALSIKSIALIESMDLSFGQGMTVFTGETGAGKSILLDAIGLVLGERGDTALIRRDTQSASVEALFHVSAEHQSQLDAALMDLGMDAESGELLISRELHRSGRNVCRINGRMATVQMLKELGARLVEQHGQHESHTLGRPDEQLRLLDLYGHHQDTLRQVGRAYTTWKQAHDEWSAANMDEQERMRRLDMLIFQIEEIEAADLQAGEEEILREERKRLQNAGRIQSMLQSAIGQLIGLNAGPGAIECLTDAGQSIDAAIGYDRSLEDIASLLETAAVHAEEAVRALQKRVNLVEDDPARLEEVDNRLALIRSLERKYGSTVEAVLDHLSAAKKEHDELSRHEEHLHELERDFHAAQQALHVASNALHDSRVNAAANLADEIEATLRVLSMPSAGFRIDVDIREGDGPNVWEYGPRGCDSVAFLFSANKGEPLRPISKVASGGELSRLLLGIKSVLAEVDDVDTLIFDEIDAGVSGHAVERLAQQLMSLGKSRQVLCVTHSPQVAAAADAHCLIHKMEDQAHTRTEVYTLDSDGRAAEIARLIGGSMSDETAIAHAVALLQKAASGITP